LQVRERVTLPPCATHDADHAPHGVQPLLYAPTQQLLSSSDVAPGHAAPPHDAAGLLHVRVLVRVDAPHVGAHTPKVHVDQPPFTGQHVVRASAADPPHAAVDPQYCPHVRVRVWPPQVGNHDVHVDQAL